MKKLLGLSAMVLMLPITGFAGGEDGGGNYSYMNVPPVTMVFPTYSFSFNIGDFSIAAPQSATSDLTISDRRLKNDIKTAKGLDVVSKLRGVSWTWKVDQKADAGVIAQELEKVMPSAIVTDEATGTKRVHYNQLFGPMIESTKELHGMVKSLQSENLAMKDENAKLRADFEALKKSVEALQTKTSPMSLTSN